MNVERARRRRAGSYDYRGHVIVRTTWDGPQGGKIGRWEIGYLDEQGVVTLDSIDSYRTLRDAKAAVDASYR